MLHVQIHSLVLTVPATEVSVETAETRVKGRVMRTAFMGTAQVRQTSSACVILGGQDQIAQSTADATTIPHATRELASVISVRTIPLGNFVKNVGLGVLVMPQLLGVRCATATIIQMNLRDDVTKPLDIVFVFITPMATTATSVYQGFMVTHAMEDVVIGSAVLAIY